MRFGRFAILVSCILPAVPVTAAPLAPHRAVYDLALDGASDRSGITGLAGRMVYEFNGNACEGYTVTFRFVTQIDAGETSRLTDQQTTTYEDGEGRNFRFVTRSFADRALERESRGSARLEDDGIHVEIEQPDSIEYQLPVAHFPTQHLLDLIEKARSGETFYETSIYDGSEEGDQVLITTAVIGRPARPDADDREIGALGPVAEAEYRAVDMAYFSGGETMGEELPTYRIAFKLYENGVTRDLLMDYGDFQITGTLTNLEMFEPAAEACAAP